MGSGGRRGGGTCPRAQQARGGKTVSSIYFVTNEHKSGNDREVAWARAHQGESWNFDKLEEFFAPSPDPAASSLLDYIKFVGAI